MKVVRLILALVAASASLATLEIASAQRGAPVPPPPATNPFGGGVHVPHTLGPTILPRAEPMPRMEPMRPIPEYSPPQDMRIPQVDDSDRPTLHVPPPEERRGASDYSGGDDDGDGWSNASDCHDSNASVYPGAREYADGYDFDCDGLDN